VARFYADSHVSYATLALLAGLGHQIIRCQQVGMANAKDYEHLQFAAERRAMFITHDRGLEQWNAAWQHWSNAWGSTVEHPGILIIPVTATWQSIQAAEEIDAFVRSQGAMTNQCFRAEAPGLWELRTDRIA
jgi:hypothetical protein